MSSLILLFIGVGIPFYFLYNRKSSWLTPKRKGAIAILSSLLAQFLLFFPEVDYWLLVGCSIAPIVFLPLEYFLTRFSYYVQGRNFVLWLRHSNEIDDSFLASNPHVSWWDRGISIFLLFALIALPLLPVLIGD